MLVVSELSQYEDQIGFYAVTINAEAQRRQNFRIDRACPVYTEILSPLRPLRLWSLHNSFPHLQINL